MNTDQFINFIMAGTGSLAVIVVLFILYYIFIAKDK